MTRHQFGCLMWACMAFKHLGELLCIAWHRVFLFVLMVHDRICTQPDNQQEMLNLESQLYEWWTFSYKLIKGYEPEVPPTTLVLKKKRKIFRRGWILMFPLRSVQEYDPDPFHHKGWFLVAQEHTLFKGRACELLRLLCWLLKKQSGRKYYFASKLSWNCFCLELPCETHSLGECIFPTANQELALIRFVRGLTSFV